MANSVESGVVSLESALEESLKFLCEHAGTWNVSRITNGAKRRNFYNGIRKRSVGINISDFGTHQTNNDGETFECVSCVRFKA